ncbi:MAG: hypothetical protein AABW91_02600 [Nanoarchaeota archaeon]
MKRGIVLFFIILFSFTLISALNITIDKTNFKQGETLIASISGNVLEPIDKNDIGFYKEHVQIPIIFDIVKINETYYIYGLLPFQEGNFSLKIKEVAYREFNQNKKQDLELNFTINNGFADFGINPGVFLTSSSQDFFLSNYLDKTITIYYQTDNDLNKSLTIPAQETKKLSIGIGDFDNSFLGIIIFSSTTGFTYNLPAYIIRNDSKINQNINETERLVFSLSSIDAQLKKGESYVYTTNIKNKGNKLENITLLVSKDIKKYINLSFYTLSLDKEEQKEVRIGVLFSKIGNFSGTITAKSSNFSDDINLKFSIGENTVPLIPVPNATGITCSSIKGKVCSTTQKCFGNNFETKDGWCCVGNCTDKNTPVNNGGGTNWTAVFIIIIILLAIAGFFFWKIKGTKRTARDVLKDKEKSFSERYETKGKLRNY